MFTRILYASSQPPAHPLTQVSLYYLALLTVCAGLVVGFPDLVRVATSVPGMFPQVGGSPDVFEAVGESDMVDMDLGDAVRLVSSLLSVVLLMLPISWVYMGTRRRVGFDQSVVQTMIILPIAVTGIVIIVHDSIALAFSLAGIVAGVRFRNALKDTSDALYIFAAIGVGLASGIGALGVAAVVSVFFNYTILLLWRCDYGVCPKGGPQPEYSSGLLLSSAGVDLADYASAHDAHELASVGKKKKKKKKKAKHRTPEPESAPGEAAGLPAPDEDAGAVPESASQP